MLPYVLNDVIDIIQDLCCLVYFIAFLYTAGVEALRSEGRTSVFIERGRWHYEMNVIKIPLVSARLGIALYKTLPSKLDSDRRELLLSPAIYLSLHLCLIDQLCRNLTK